MHVYTWHNRTATTSSPAKDEVNVESISKEEAENVPPPNTAAESTSGKDEKDEAPVDKTKVKEECDKMLESSKSIRKDEKSNAEQREKAIEVMAEALQKIVEAFGEMAPECAPFYSTYGRALVTQAQDNSDALGIIHTS